jgi:rubrerythrin
MGNAGNPMHLLYKLVELDFDAIEAYEAAIERLDDDVGKKALAAFKADHERHVRELGSALRDMGFDPPEQGDIRRVLAKGKVVLGTIAGDRGILMAMKANEDDTNAAYER